MTKRRFAGMVGVACASIALTAAAPASADTTKYAPQDQSRTFDGGPGGWSSSSDYGGLCIPALTCFTVGAEHVADGGPTGAGNGFLRVDLFTIADAVTRTSAVLSSPSFRYRGADGEEPRKLTFSMDRRTDLGALIPAISDNATYTVKAVPDFGPAVTLIDTTSMVGAEDIWTRVEPVTVDSDELVIGRRYVLEITSTFLPQVEVIGTGSVDYDNVVLAARGGGGGGGGGGNAGPGEGFTTGIKNGIGDAVLDGNRLSVLAGCPRSVAPHKCKLRVTAKLNRRGPKATETDRLKVKPGGKKTALLRIKPEYQEKIENRKRIVVRVRAHAGDKTRTVIKRVKIRKG
jgi:hypothetical protein